MHNTAVADSSEKIPATGETETEVHSPILEIVKESDKKEYASGEKGYYKLTVRQLREDVTDQNIVIEDKLETQGASIVKDSIFVKKNGIELKDAKIEAGDTGFVIQTGASLSDMDKIEVCYEVVFKTESTEPEKIVNTAKARGDISPEIAAQQEVYVKTKAEPLPHQHRLQHRNQQKHQSRQRHQNLQKYRNRRSSQKPHQHHLYREPARK